MLEKSKKMCVAVMALLFAVAIACAAIPLARTARAVEEVTVLSELGGDFTPAADGWIETKPGTNYLGEYDFAAHDYGIALTFDLELTQPKGQIWLIFKTGPEGNQPGLRYLIHTGATAGNLLAAVMYTNIPEKTISNTIRLEENVTAGSVYTVNLSLQWAEDYNSFTTSLSFTDQVTKKVYQAFDQFSYDFSAATSAAPDYGTTIKDNNAVRLFVSDATATLRLKDNGVETGPVDPDPENPPVDPEQPYIETSTSKSPEYTNVNVMDIEDFMSTVSVFTKTAGATVTDEGNLLLDATVYDDRNPNFSFKSKEGKYKGNYGIKFRTVNDMQDPETAESIHDPTYNAEQKVDSNIDIFIELGAMSQSAYVSPTSSYVVRFFWNEPTEQYMVQFYANGLKGQMASVDFKTSEGFSSEFLPRGEEYTVEAGRFDSETKSGDKLVTLYLEIKNSEEKSLYAQCAFGGSCLYSGTDDGGYVRLASASYVRTSPVQILAVDSTKTVTENYVPDYTEAANVVDHDISDYLPIGQDGITYTTTSDSDTKNIINYHGLINNSKNDMYMSFSGNYLLTLAFFTDRYENGNCTAGYQIIFTPTEITIQSYAGTVIASQTKAYAMPENTKVKVSVRLVMLYIDGLSMGERLSLYIGEDSDEPFLTGDFDLQGTGILPTYFDGIMSGNGSVTIYPYSTTATASNGIAMTIDEDEKVEIGKQFRLEAETTKEIIGDAISFEITEGSEFAEIIYNEGSGRYYLKGNQNGVVKVVASVTNEFGTFKSEAVSVQIGTGVSEQPGDGDPGSSCDCANSSMTPSKMGAALIFAAAAGILFLKKR